MAGPGVLRNSIREPKVHAAPLKPERSIMKHNHDSLKKEGAPPCNQRAARCTCERLPPVPKRSDPPPMQYPPYQDNYVDYNAKHITELANCREPRFQVVDSKDGHVMDLAKSGLVPVYREKHSYGRLPGYLKQSNRLPECERQQTEDVKRETAQPQTEPEPRKNRPHPARPPVSKEIEALQKRWIELEERLRLISFSRPDKREAIEDELRSIEVRLRMAKAR